MTLPASVTSHRWGEAQGSGETARLHWLAPLVVRAHVNQRITGNPLEDWLGWSRRRWLTGNNRRVLVLGCGEGWVERALAAYLAGDAVTVEPRVHTGLGGEIATLLTEQPSAEPLPSLAEALATAQPALDPTDPRDRCARALVAELERF